MVKAVIEDIITSGLELLTEEEYVKLENYLLDGTIREVNPNKYSWVHFIRTRHYKQILPEKVKDLIVQIDR